MSNKEKKRKKHHHKKHYTVLPFITTPIIFILISMVVMVPALVVGMNYCVDAVHSAQQVLSIDYNDKDISVDTDGDPDACEYIGTLACKSAGLDAEIYYGVNRVSLRNGCAMSEKSDFDGAIYIAGYSVGDFRAISKLDDGDIIELNSAYGNKSYKVTKTVEADKLPEISGKCLVLSTSKDNLPFSYYDSSKLFVVATEV